MRVALLLAFALASGPASAVTMEWVTVGNPGNVCDPQEQGCFGSVPEVYRISKYEVTNSQYTEFLNAKAASDPFGLYNPEMDASTFGGISRTGSPGSYNYETISPLETMPVNFVSFFDSLRFANWMHNGQGDGDTETGAYTLLSGSATPSNADTVTRNSGAIVFLPSENEWYKAAYHDATGASATGYFDFPAGSDTQTACTETGAAPNTANCDNQVGRPIFVGSYTGAASPYGTFDQGGNVWEWNELIVEADKVYRGLRGGSFGNAAFFLGADERLFGEPTFELNNGGFRVAMIPEPSTGLLVLAGLLGFAVRRGCC